MAVLLETPFDPQALFTALNYISNVFNAASWQNLLKLFFMIALINGIVSVGVYRKTDYVKQFIIALGFASVLSYPINENLAIKRADTEKVYTINNSKAPFILVEGIRVVNLTTKWFTSMAGASINSPNYTGMYDAGIGSNANIIRNSIDMVIPDARVKADLVQFIKECTLYDIRDGAVSMHDLVNKGNGFDLIFNNTSPARFVSINSSTGKPEVKTCFDAAQLLKTQVNSEAQKALTGKASMFFYQKDVAPLVVYSTAVQSSYQAQLNINSNVSQIAKQNMFNHLLEVSGEDIGKLLNDPSMAESAAIHMGVARAAKKAAFQQSIVAQLGREILPAMSSWFAIIIIMLFPFVVLIFVITQFNNMWQILVGYMGTLFWICCWQPIFAMINGLANWELGRQLAKTGAFRQEGIPYGFVTPVYDTLLSNHSMVGWMVMLTPIIAGMVVYGTYRGFSHLGNSIFSTFSGASSAVGNEMSDGNLNMGNINLGNSSLGNSTQNTTSANKYQTSPSLHSGQFQINSAVGHDQTIFRDGELTIKNDHDSVLSETSKLSNIHSSASNKSETNSSLTNKIGTNLENVSFAGQEFGQTTANEKSNSTSTGYNNSTNTYHRTGNEVRNGTENIYGNRWSNDKTNIDDTTTTGVDTSYTGGNTNEFAREETSMNFAINSSIGSTQGANQGNQKGLLAKAASLIGVNASVGYNTGVSDGKVVDRSHGKDQKKIVSLTTGDLVHKQTGDFGSNSTTNSNMRYSDSGKETSNSTYTSGEVTDKQSTTHTDSTSRGHRAQLTDDREVSLSTGNNISTNQENAIMEGLNYQVDLGMVGNQDLPATSLYQSNPEIFSEIMSQRYGMESGKNAWEFYEELKGLSKRDARIFLQDFALKKRKEDVANQNQFKTPPPQSPDDNQKLYEQQKHAIQDQGRANIDTLGGSSNYIPK